MQGSLGSKAGKVKQWPPFQQISRVYSFEGHLTPILTAGLFAKPGERRSKDSSISRERSTEQVQNHCPVPPGKQAGWLGAPA